MRCQKSANLYAQKKSKSIGRGGIIKINISQKSANLNMFKKVQIFMGRNMIASEYLCIKISSFFNYFHFTKEFLFFICADRRTNRQTDKRTDKHPQTCSENKPPANLKVFASGKYRNLMLLLRRDENESFL